jgi:hypothetical protein
MVNKESCCEVRMSLLLSEEIVVARKGPISSRGTNQTIFGRLSYMMSYIFFGWE